MAGKSDTERSDVARIRAVLARELETINEYEAFAEDSSNPEVRAFFLHLAAEEKEHVSEATHMLRMLDKGQDAHFAKPFVPGHFQSAMGGASSEPAGPGEEPSPAVSHAPPTVGRIAAEPLTSLPPQRLIYGVPAPPPSANSHPLTVGTLRRGGGGGGSGGGR
ncbi:MULTISPECIES: ferritin family protein [Corallococcus]|uniref:ferritin family protein n=1 Tax=Corallococcus TaxID=83461 RepID=UPI0011807A57|nr:MULTISPECIES: ferritin family protein [Corallococcus]NBD09152.1 ferritin [Corallococcus silvisoli]TSC31181.1 ferritin [Corallococcus sp. Z5C101001]